MTRDELDLAVRKFLDNGGEITELRYADSKMQAKSRRMFHHKDKALNGSVKSKDFLERERARERGMIFSRDERMKK
tara:strand:+ start:92 stop:319 length:228 start_codon:yes stop_codon:yes gene_type:complete